MQSGWGPPQYPPPTAWARPRIDKSLLRPKAWWYAAAAIPLALGVAATAIFVVLAVRAFPDEPRQFRAPASLELHLKANEEQTIYRQTRGAGVPGLTFTPSCTVRRLGTGQLVPVRGSGSTTLTFGGNKYVTQLKFGPPAAGAYRVTCRPFGTDSQPLAIGESPHLARFGLRIVAAIGSFVLGLLLCGGAVAFVAIRRHSHKRRLEREAAGLP
jgi:hypothetical protein